MIDHCQVCGERADTQNARYEQETASSRSSRAVDNSIHVLVVSRCRSRRANDVPELSAGLCTSLKPGVIAGWLIAAQLNAFGDRLYVNRRASHRPLSRVGRQMNTWRLVSERRDKCE